MAKVSGCGDQFCWLYFKSGVDLTQYNNATLEFDRFVDGELDSGEYLSLSLPTSNTGTSFTQYQKWTSGQADDDQWYRESIDLAPYLSYDNFKILFRGLANETTEEVAIDNVRIGHTTNTTSTPPPTVPPPNNPPQIGSISSTLSVTAGDRFTVNVDATDADAGDTLTYSLTQRPTGATINSYTGLVSWQTSTATTTGNHAFSVSVSDGKTADTASFTVMVNAAPPPPPPPTTTPPAPSSTAFTEDFESGFGKWTVSGNWQAETLDDTNAASIPGHTKSNIVAEGDGCDTACTLTLTTHLDLSSYANATLEFDRFEDDVMRSTDYLKVEIGKNGAYKQVLYYPNTDAKDVWTHETYDMSNYLTSGVTIRFTAVCGQVPLQVMPEFAQIW